MSIKLARPEHEVAYRDVCELLSRHAAEMTPLDLLAVAANVVGKIVAMQDRRVTTPEQAMEVVSVNLEMGNREALALDDLVYKTTDRGN